MTSGVPGEAYRLPDPTGRPFRATVRPPGSKSITNRLLLLGALARGETVLRDGLTDADDARRMLDALGTLGVAVQETAQTLRINGVDGRWSCAGDTDRTLFLNNAGTATRFLTAAAALAGDGGPHGTVIDGNPRMRARPIGELIDLLRALGVMIDELDRPGYVPLRVRPPDGGAFAPMVAVGRTRSSQFISALMLIAPFLPAGLELRLDGPLTSPSYVEMTAALLRRVGADVAWSDTAIRIAPGGIDGFDLAVEPDASGGTYFLGAAALVAGATITLDGIGASSVQGDARFVDELERMGASVTRTADQTTITGPETLRPIESDLARMPDAAMTLATVCCFATGPSVLRGLRTLRDKETDRLAALKVELEKIGATISIVPDGDDEALRVAPPRNLGSGEVAFDTYDDHRMAMSLALISLRRAGVVIRDPGCVGKTYASYWEHFERATTTCG